MAMNHDAVVHEVGDVPDCPVGLPNQRGFYHYNRSLLYQEFGEYSVYGLHLWSACPKPQSLKASKASFSG
ncbi:hypothetical protein E4U32_000121 [Claviceps aff. humidiphila group G2b]|nr:hypothetical protein E4U32_000121 [Claviceps aff. humidiphila group G2b]